MSTDAEDDAYELTVGHDDAGGWVDWGALRANFVLDNDTDSDPGQTLTVGTWNGPSYGEWLAVGESRSYTYEASDGQGGTDGATLTVRVVRPNQNPTAHDDAYEMEIAPESSGAEIWLAGFQPDLGNDTDPDGDGLTISENGNPGATLWVAANSSYSYAYSVSDGHGGTGQAQVTIRVHRSVVLPVAHDDPDFAGVDGQLISGNVLSNDEPGNSGLPMTAVIVDNPMHQFDFQWNSDGTFSYIPSPDFNGIDRFSYKIVCGEYESETAFVSLKNFVSYRLYTRVLDKELAINIENTNVDENGDPALNRVESIMTSDPAFGGITLLLDVESWDILTDNGALVDSRLSAVQPKNHVQNVATPPSGDVPSAVNLPLYAELAFPNEGWGVAGNDRNSAALSALKPGARFGIFKPIPQNMHFPNG